MIKISGMVGFSTACYFKHERISDTVTTEKKVYSNSIYITPTVKIFYIIWISQLSKNVCKREIKIEFLIIIICKIYEHTANCFYKVYLHFSYKLNLIQEKIILASNPIHILKFYI